MRGILAWAAIMLAVVSFGWVHQVRAQASAAADVQRVLDDYRLGAGDKIRVIVFGEEALTGEFFVGGSGKVSLPLIGEVQAAGLTIKEFQAEVTTSLQEGYLKDPKVSAEVLTYRPFYILGEVNKPGEYPYTNGLTVLNAVATANGFTYRANTKKVFVRHARDTSEHEYPLTTSTAVAPGDTIRIAERFF
jgi:polysaccharide export outer membrane protein